MNIALWLERAGKSHPSRPAAALGERVVLDYGALAARAARLAGALRTTCKLAAGDRVAIVAKNCVAYVEVLYGIWHAGLAAVPANAKLHGAELGYILEHSGARVCLVSDGLDAAVAPFAPKSLERLIVIGSEAYERLLAVDAIAAVPRAAEDLAWLFYTSGTTGRPKGAMLTHRVLSAASHAYVTEVDPIAPGDTILHAAPMSHGSGLYMMAHVARLGINAVPESGGFEPAEIFRLFGRWPRTSMFAAPTMIKRLVDAGDVADRRHPRWSDRLASAGRPYACVEVSVADSEDRSLPAGETGEILCRGEVVCPGYWKDREASAATLRNGWLHTGDVGAFDGEGYLTLKDRSKDVVISGGSNIYPREVEEVLLKHARVREVSVIGRPDREWGEVVVAYVVGDAPAGELDELCLGAIARFKRPKDYVFVDALPKSNYGKILKTELRATDKKYQNPN
jgi:long-chain acyl-CoA synthetase